VAETGEQPDGWLIAEESAELFKEEEKEPKIRIAAAEHSADKPKELAGNCLRMKGTTEKKTGVYQELDIQGDAGDNYVVGGWCRAWAAPSKGQQTFRLRVQFLKKNGLWVSGGTADWNEEWVDW
jgi:hypothetical protein